MKENIGDILFDVLTSEFKDKIDRNKDFIDYLKEKTKTELLSVYLLYGYTGTDEDIEEEIVKLQKQKKEEVIKRIMDFLDNKIVSILQFFNDKRMNDVKKIAYSQEFSEFNKNKVNQFSLEMILVLKKLNFIYCKKEPDGIIIHMPKYIRDKINNKTENQYLDYYDEILSYSKGIADTYGAIHVKDVYDIIKNDFSISFERYNNIIKFISILELEPIYYSFEYQSLCSFNLRDEKIMDVLTSSEGIIIYNRELYEEIGSDNYLYSLKEYREFRKFLLMYYDFDINDDEMLRGEIVTDYIDNAQVDEKEAVNSVKEAMDRYFDIDDFEKQTIIGYVDKIRKKMPVWKQGGKIDFTEQFSKVGRNEPCPCGSGKKYKNCCGKNV